jgi:hypothetical protein
MTVDGWQGLQGGPAWLATAFSAQALPLLPRPDLMPWAWHLGWAVLLAWLALRLCGRLPVALGRAVALLAAAWALLPGEASAAYGLGLVFQCPSLMTVVLCARGLLRRRQQPGQGKPSANVDPRMSEAWMLLGIALGWALLLDTFVLLPFDLYPSGFGMAALVLVLLALGLPWLLWGGQQQGLAACALVALLLYVALRLPSGNLWDALLDPLLWLWLQARCLRRLGVWLRLRARGASAATRA